MDTSCSERSNQGRPGAWDPFMITCCALRALGAVKEPIRETRERTELAPSDTANTTTISQISSWRSRSGSGCGETQAGTAETDSSGTERMLAGAFAERPYREDDGLRLLPADHRLVMHVDQETPVQFLQLRRRLFGTL